MVQCEVNAHEQLRAALFILWLWLSLSFTFLIVNTTAWAMRITAWAVMPLSYKTRRLNVMLSRDPDLVDDDIQQFAEVWLKPDGALLLELLEYNVSMNAACGVVKAAWLQHQAKRCDVIQPPADNMAQSEQQVSRPPDVQELEEESIPVMSLSQRAARKEEEDNI